MVLAFHLIVVVAVHDLHCFLQSSPIFSSLFHYHIPFTTTYYLPSSLLHLPPYLLTSLSLLTFSPHLLSSPSLSPHLLSLSSLLSSPSLLTFSLSPSSLSLLTTILTFSLSLSSPSLISFPHTPSPLCIVCEHEYLSMHCPLDTLVCQVKQALPGDLNRKVCIVAHGCICDVDIFLSLHHTHL